MPLHPNKRFDRYKRSHRARWATGAVLFLVTALADSGFADTGDFNRNQYRAECRRGITIYCLAMGMEEEKEGRWEEAMNYYRMACEKHRTPGHLRACTPLLALAQRMGRLEEAAAPLEKRCREGHTITCYYLGREYLKIPDYPKAYKHLEPLCRQGFRPEDVADYGPCYHMAMGFQYHGSWKRARELLKLDCDRDPVAARHSCAALAELPAKRAKERQAAWDRVRNFEWAEVVLVLMVALPVAGLPLWVFGGPPVQRYLRFHAPAIELLLWLLWEVWPKRFVYHPADKILIGLTMAFVVGLAALAHWKLKTRNDAGTLSS